MSDILDKRCPNCQNRLAELPGIGPACVLITCPVGDGDLRWLELTEEQKIAERIARLEECRDYKERGHPAYQELGVV